MNTAIREAISLVILLTVFHMIGCRQELAHGLDESEANRVIATLSDQGIPAEATLTGRGDSQSWTVSVPSAESLRARLILRDRELPGQEEAGLGEVFDRGGLLPTPTEEQALLVRAIQGELVETLESIDGVLAARVHISVAEGSRSLIPNGTDESKTTASVLVRFHAENPPLSETQVKGIVAGAVTSLAPERVTVVMLSRPQTNQIASQQLVSLGPIAVSQDSITTLQLWLGGATGAVGLLALILIWLTLRFLSLRRQLSTAEAALASSRETT